MLLLPTMRSSCGFGKVVGLLFWLVLVMTSCGVSAQPVGDDTAGPLAMVRNKFNALDDRGKLVTGAAVGFVGSRIVVGSAMTVVKVGAAAFLTAEILDRFGVLDYHDVIEDHYDTITKVKDLCFAQADRFRMTVRRSINPNMIQNFIEKERMASLGVASGALVGIVL